MKVKSMFSFDHVDFWPTIFLIFFVTSWKPDNPFLTYFRRCFHFSAKYEKPKAVCTMHLFHYELAYAQCIVTTTNACCSMDFFVCPKEKKRILAIVQNAVKDLQANAKLCIPSIIHTKRPIARFCLCPITLSRLTYRN